MLSRTPVLLRILVSHPRLLGMHSLGPVRACPRADFLVAVSHAQVRKRDGIPGSTVRDCCMSTWCCCCTICQLARHEGLAYDKYGGVLSPTGEKVDAGRGSESAGQMRDMSMMMARV